MKLLIHFTSRVYNFDLNKILTFRDIIFSNLFYYFLIF